MDAWLLKFIGENWMTLYLFITMLKGVRFLRLPLKTIRSLHCYQLLILFSGKVNPQMKQENDIHPLLVVALILSIMLTVGLISADYYHWLDSRDIPEMAHK